MDSPAKEGDRPWGHYEVLLDTDTHKVKRIIVQPGKRISLQKHTRRSEHWVVVNGEAKVTLDGRTVYLQPHHSIDIPCQAVHRIECVGNEPLVFVEVQMGDYFGEDDIIRIDDDFGRHA
ncbi:MAG: phosphomannose isomerase type II C-terminal cupin domain [Nitrospinae bacterium]|nr:phosphomannose isomerase type II C-terminal cupin domain [Nitrospinota bacterium]